MQAVTIPESRLERMLVDKFLERTLAYNSEMIEIVNRHGFIAGGCFGIQSGGANRNVFG